MGFDVGLEHDTLAETESSSRESTGARRRPRPVQATAYPLVVGEYVVQEPLGRGGQGAVFRAWDPNLNRTVALKLMHGGRDENAQILEEAQNGAQVVHPNVVTIFGARTWNGQVVIEMEFLPRGSLREWLCDEQRPVEQLVARFLEAARGLAAIHAAGLVHRDFKPDNVLLKENGTAAVGDFGLSRARDNAAESRSGTRSFMAPELRANGPATPASDQYAFCVALFWALTRTYPQENRDVFFPPEVPGWLRRIITRGLQRSPAERYPSMDALIEDLENTPEVRRRALLRTLAVAGGLTALLTAGLIVATSESPQRRALREGTEQVQRSRNARWSPRLVDAMQKNFTALAGTVGTQTFERVRQRVEPLVEAWARVSTAACSLKEPVARRNTQSCLEERRAVLSALSDYLARTTDASMVKDVIRTLSRELKPIDTCSQSTTVALDRLETPTERQLRAALAPAFVLRAAGRTADAQLVAADVFMRAEAEPDAQRVKAEAALLSAQLMAELGSPIADKKLVSAIDLAESVGADELRARGWISLMGYHVRRLEYAEAADANKRATAIVERLGRPPLLLAPLLNERGNFEYVRDRLPEANAIFVELRDLLLASYGPDDPAVLHATNNILLSGSAQAQVAGFEALLTQTARELGESHPETLFTRHNLAAALYNNGQCVLADAHVTDLIATRTNGGVHLQPALGAEYGLRARIKVCLGKLDEAIADQRLTLERVARSASDNQMHQELVFLYEQLKAARRPRAELDVVINDICVRGFGLPDETECPRAK